MKRPRKPHKRQFQKDQPKSARDEELCQLALCLAAAKGEECSGSCEETKDGCAEVRNPTGEEKCGAGLRQVGWTEVQQIMAEKIAHVIQRHDHYRQAPKQVDTFKSWPRACRFYRNGGDADWK